MPVDDGLDAIDWSAISTAYGPATEVPELIRGLRGSRFHECFEELGSALTHQTDRVEASAFAVPFLVDVAVDVGGDVAAHILGLLSLLAVGIVRGPLDWRHQRDEQIDRHDRAAWVAVAAEGPRIRTLLLDDTAHLQRSALVVLAWIGDSDPVVKEAIETALRGGEDVDCGNAWMACVVLGWKPESIDPENFPTPGPTARFAAAIASMRFNGDAATTAAVDELITVLLDDGDLGACEFFLEPPPQDCAQSTLAATPTHLFDYTSEQLLGAMRRGAPFHRRLALEVYLLLHLGPWEQATPYPRLTDTQRRSLEPLCPVLSGWRNSNDYPGAQQTLARFGLPTTSEQLHQWLETGHVPDAKPSRWESFMHKLVSPPSMPDLSSSYDGTDEHHPNG